MFNSPIWPYTLHKMYGRAEETILEAVWILAALGRRLTKRLRIRILYNDLKGGQEYSRM